MIYPIKVGHSRPDRGSHNLNIQTIYIIILNMYKKYDDDDCETYESFTNQSWTIKDVEE